MGLFKRSKSKNQGVLLPDVDSDVTARGHVYFQSELRSIGEKRREFRLVPDPRNEVDPDTVNIYDGTTRVGWIGKGRAHDNCAYGDALKLALTKVSEVRVVGIVRRVAGPGIEYEWSIDLRAPDPITAASILGGGAPKIVRRRIDVKLTRDKDTCEAVARLLARHGATHLDGGTLIAELSPSGKYKGQVRLRCEVAGEVVGHAAASTLTDIPEVFRAAASGPVLAQVVIGDFDGTPWSAATALTD
jgi:hypothetical protein